MHNHVRSKALILAVLMAPLFSLLALADESISENRSISDFSSIEVRGGYTIYLTQDSTVSLRLVGAKKELSNVITEVVNRRLVIKHKPGIRLFSFDHDDVKVYVGFRDINAIDLSGSNDVIGQNPLQFKDLGIDVSGSGDISMELQAVRLDVDLSGSGDLSLRGAVNDLNVAVSGSGDIKCLDLKTQKAVLSISGSGDAKLDVSEELSVSIAGSGDVAYRGNPGKIKQHVSGSGEIRKLLE